MIKRVLVVDDDTATARLLATWLGDKHETFVAHDAEEGLAMLLRETPDAAIVDVVMPAGGGARFVNEARRRLPGCVLVGMSGQAGASEFVELFRRGVSDFLPKPFTRDELVRALVRASRVRALREALAWQDPADEPDAAGDPFAPLVGESEAFRAAVGSLKLAAGVDAGMLLVGETGTGKELATRCVHAASARRDAPLLVVACQALPASLLEAELFGHAAGAFTGATQRAGRFEEARGGTIVLSDVAAIPIDAQARLLRVLEQGTIQRIGEPNERAVDVRVIATASRDPWEDVSAGRLREDLAHRLNRIRVDLPPLRERGDDLLLLATKILVSQAKAEQRAPKALAPSAVAKLREHAWPGNVRELANVLQRASIVAGASELIEAKHVHVGRLSEASLDPADWPLPEDGLDLPSLLASVERRLVVQAMERAGGHHGRAAALLRIGRSTLERKLVGRVEGDGASGRA